jgi:hypothetical protein
MHVLHIRGSVIGVTGTVNVLSAVMVATAAHAHRCDSAMSFPAVPPS